PDWPARSSPSKRAVVLPIVHAGVTGALVVRDAHRDRSLTLAAPAVLGMEGDPVDTSVAGMARAFRANLGPSIHDQCIGARTACAAAADRLVLGHVGHRDRDRIPV